MISKTIFREYDIRGKYNIDLFLEDARCIGKAIATKLIDLNINNVVIGYDNRISSPILAEKLIDGVISSGINVITISLSTTPMVYFARYYLKEKASIIVTASHNPKEYNGFKISYNGINNICGRQVYELYDIIINNKYKTSKNKATIKQIDISKEYVNYLVNKININNPNLKVIYDCGNGTTSIIADKVFKALKINAIGIFNKSDPTFPNHHPDPNVRENLILLSKRVLEEKADIGVAFDGDGDRVGVINEKGEYVTSEEYSIAIWRNIYDKVTNKKAIYDVKCSKILSDELDKLGIEKILNRTGNSYLQKLSYKENIPYAMEESGHTIFRDKFPGFEDAIYTSLRLIEILSIKGVAFSNLYSNINYYFNTQMLNFPTTEEKKFNIVSKVKEYCINRGYNIDLTDGVKVIEKEFTALIRCSNTSPDITYRFEATTKEKLKEIKTEFEELLNKLS